MRKTILGKNDFGKIGSLFRGKSHLLFLWAAFAAILLCYASHAHATWQKVFQQPAGHEFISCFFFNERVGFIVGDLRDGIYKTTDGGQTWSLTKIPNLNFTNLCAVTQILMTDSLNGWLTFEPPDSIPFPGLFRTSDGGVSWNPTDLLGQFSNIYETSRGLIIASRYGTGYVSADFGTTFTPAIPASIGVDFVDNLNGVAAGYAEEIWYHSTDGGLTWTGLSKSDTTESWSVYALKGTPNFFTAGEGDWHDGSSVEPSSVRRSTDYGATWSKFSTLPFATTGHITGFGATLYVQVDSVFENGYFPGFSGIFRSSDSGRSWISIGGPSNEYDTRFAVLGCRGEVMYAFDERGGVWKTIDGGDGSLTQYQFPPTALKVDSIDVCGPRDTIISIKNLGCGTLIITKASAPPMPVLGIIDPATGAAPKFPISIPPQSDDSLELILQASLSGPYQTRVEIELTDDGVLKYDTITVSSALKYYNPLRVFSNVRFDSVALCDSRDTTLTIQNDSCFTVQIVNSQLKYGANYILDSVYSNDSITAFSSKTYGIDFSPAQTGSDIDSLIVNFLVLGKPLRMSYPITGTGCPDKPELLIADRFGNSLPNEINFDTITRCQDSIFAFTIFEQGCDSLFVKVGWLDTTMSTQRDTEQFLWYAPQPRWLTKNTPDTAGVEALGRVLGSHQGFLRISDSAKGAKSATVQMIPYKVFVKRGPVTLALDDSPKNYDTIAFCEVKDTTIEVRNLGCDTMHITQAAISDPNFIFVSPPALPLVVKPNDSVSLTVRYLPVVSSAASGSLNIVTDADSDSAPTRTIPLSGYAIPTDTIEFEAVATNITVAPGDTSTILILPGKDYKSAGLNSIRIGLEYNGDIMSPFNPKLNATSGISGAAVNVQPELPVSPKLRELPIVISGNNMQLDSADPLLRIQFLIYLSDSAWTDFRIVNFQLNNSDFNFGKCVLGSVTDTGTIDLRFVCGDTLLYNFLRYGTNFSPDDGIAPVSGIVYPDPIVEPSALSIPFRALRAVSVGIEVMDWSGAVVYSGDQYVPEAGATEYQIAGLQLPSGAYHYRLHPLDGGRVAATGGFVVLR